MFCVSEQIDIGPVCGQMNLIKCDFICQSGFISSLDLHRIELDHVEHNMQPLKASVSVYGAHKKVRWSNLGKIMQ